jgi:hypothetical protein
MEEKGKNVYGPGMEVTLSLSSTIHWAHETPMETEKCGLNVLWVKVSVTPKKYLNVPTPSTSVP